MSEVKEFSTTPDFFEVKIDGRTYKVNEASGDAACTYRNFMLDKTKLGPNGKPVSMAGIADAEPLLVSMCTFDPDGSLVPLGTVRGWPNKIQKWIYKEIKKISEIESDDQDAPGNVQSDTQVG